MINLVKRGTRRVQTRIWVPLAYMSGCKKLIHVHKIFQWELGQKAEGRRQKAEKEPRLA